MRVSKLTKTMTALTGVLVLTLTGCASSSDTEAVAETETSEVTDPVVEETITEEVVEEPIAEDPVVEEPVEEETETETGFFELKFGDALETSSEDGTSSTITIGSPTKAKCQYSSIGCDKPEIGDRVIQIPILIQNTGEGAVEWGRSYFILEYADGTQVEMGDGAARDYTPDNALGYDNKIRVGGQLKSVLVFEAPEGPFSLLILTNAYDGEPFAAWS